MDFYAALKDIEQAETIVVDIESNGLQPYSGNRMIGVAVYVPRSDKSYYFPFRHGVGKIEVELDDPTKGFHELTWQTKAKNALYARYWWGRASFDFENLPPELEDKLKAVLLKRHVIFHNAQFDIAGLYCEGYGLPKSCEDTMIGLHLVHEDMNNIWVSAPFKWSDDDRKQGRCSKEQVGDWALDEIGRPILKRQMANKELKWFSAYIGLPGAMEGELGLSQEMRKLEIALAKVALENYSDPMNRGLIYKTYEKGDRSDERVEAQFNRIFLKFKLSDKAQMWMLPSSSVAPYAMRDVELTWGLRQWIMPILEDWDNVTLYHELNEQLLWVTSQMERNGLKLDVDEARKQLVAVEDAAHQLLKLMQATIYEYFKGEVPDKYKDFNPDSPQQVVAVLNCGLLKELYLGLTPSWWSDEARTHLDTYDSWAIISSRKEVLERYSKHPFIQMMLEYRKATKTGKTYLTNWLNFYDGNFFIHPNFKITGTVSGRLSSSGDAGNFQNIPDRGFRIKAAFIPPSPDWTIVNIDYGQLELRLAAWVAEVLLGLDGGELKMTKMFEQGIDMHAYTRDQIGVRDIVWPGMTDYEICTGPLRYDEEKLKGKNLAKIVAKQARYIAKTMNFGLLYNGGKKMLAKLLKMTESTADVLVKRWRALYPAFPRANRYYQEEALKWRPLPNNPAKKCQYVTQPISGRHRKFDKYRETVVFINDLGEKEVYNEKESEASKAFNNLIQGLGGYIANTSAYKLAKRFEGDATLLYAIIHDSLDFFMHRQTLQYIPEICRVMCDWPVRPALTVDVEYSETNWQDMETSLHFDGKEWDAVIEDREGNVVWKSEKFLTPDAALNERKKALAELGK